MFTNHTFFTAIIVLVSTHGYLVPVGAFCLLLIDAPHCPNIQKYIKKCVFLYFLMFDHMSHDQITWVTWASPYLELETMPYIQCLKFENHGLRETREYKCRQLCNAYVLVIRSTFMKDVDNSFQTHCYLSYVSCDRYLHQLQPFHWIYIVDEYTYGYLVHVGAFCTSDRCITLSQYPKIS